MPPMLPIWRSTITRSGSCSSTAGATAWPVSTSMISVSGSPTTADDIGPHRRGVAGHHDRAHGRQANGCRPASAKTWSATSPRPWTSWTSTSSSGTSATGDGATWATRAAKAASSRRFTAW